MLFFLFYYKNTYQICCFKIFEIHVPGKHIGKDVTCRANLRYTQWKPQENSLFKSRCLMKYRNPLYMLPFFTAHFVLSHQNPECLQVHIGGTLRFNYNYSDRSQTHRNISIMQTSKTINISFRRITMPHLPNN